MSQLKAAAALPAIPSSDGNLIPSYPMGAEADRVGPAAEWRETAKNAATANYLRRFNARRYTDMTGCGVP